MMVVGGGSKFFFEGYYGLLYGLFFFRRFNIFVYLIVLIRFCEEYMNIGWKYGGKNLEEIEVEEYNFLENRNCIYRYIVVYCYCFCF